MKAQLLLSVVLATSASLASADPPRIYSPFQGLGRLSGEADALRIAIVAQHLELTQEQRKQLKEIHNNERSAFTEAVIFARKIPLGSDGLTMSERLLLLSQDSRRRANADARGVLLPHQIDKLEPIVAQSQIAAIGFSGFLTSKESISPVHLEGERAAAFPKRAAEIEKTLQRKILALKEAAVEELLSDLTDTERRKLLKLIGDETMFFSHRLTPAEELGSGVASQKKRSEDE